MQEGGRKDAGKIQVRQLSYNCHTVENSVKIQKIRFFQSEIENPNFSLAKQKSEMKRRPVIQ